MACIYRDLFILAAVHALFGAKMFCHSMKKYVILFCEFSRYNYNVGEREHFAEKFFNRTRGFSNFLSGC